MSTKTVIGKVGRKPKIQIEIGKSSDGIELAADRYATMKPIITAIANMKVEREAEARQDGSPTSAGGHVWYAGACKDEAYFRTGRAPRGAAVLL